MSPWGRNWRSCSRSRKADGRWRKFNRAEKAIGRTDASYSFYTKLSVAVGGGLGGFLLSASGYVPKALQTPAADHAIQALFTLGPAIFGILAVVVMCFYKLDGKLFQKIVDDLEKRVNDPTLGAM
ncbi:MAG: hypothetical protein GY866_29850 [Proteobacteria bacterium]|nr:hypothetical protein [Pseudomonadota bacterium]